MQDDSSESDRPDDSEADKKTKKLLGEIKDAFRQATNQVDPEKGGSNTNNAKTELGIQNLKTLLAFNTLQWEQEQHSHSSSFGHSLTDFPRVWLTSKEIADIVGITARQVSNWLREGTLTIFGQQGTRYHVSCQEVESKRLAHANKKRSKTAEK